MAQEFIYSLGNLNFNYDFEVLHDPETNEEIIITLAVILEEIIWMYTLNDGEDFETLNGTPVKVILCKDQGEIKQKFKQKLNEIDRKSDDKT